MCIRDRLKGVSSWYGPNFHGKLTANGEVYDMYGVTAAHKTLTLGTVVRVTNLDNGKSLILRINDRGPYVDGRILDCSFGAAKKLGLEKNCVVLSTAHPCKFPRAIEDAISKTEKLPEGLKYVYDREEKFEVISNDINKVKDYVINSI